jgi:hypothetical protein
MPHCGANAITGALDDRSRPFASSGQIRPACTFVQVSGSHDPTWLVEIEADCVVEWATAAIGLTRHR